MAVARRNTALGVARERFVGGLGQKAEELRAAVGALSAAGSPQNPSGARPAAGKTTERSRRQDSDELREREVSEVRRRLHALYASAQVFGIETVVGALAECIKLLDTARQAQRSLTDRELERLRSVAKDLPRLANATSTTRATEAAEASGWPKRVSGRPRAFSSDSIRPQSAPVATGPSQSPSSGFISSPDVPSRSGNPDSLRPTASRHRVDRRHPSERPAAPLPAGMDPAATPGSGPDASARRIEMLETVAAALVVGREATLESLRDVLPAERLETFAATDLKQAVALSRSRLPDLILVEHDAIASAPGDFASALRSQPLLENVPVILLHHEPLERSVVRELGAQGALALPVSADRLASCIREQVFHSDAIAPVTQTAPLGELTLDEVSERLGAELRRGLVDAAEGNAQTKIPFGYGSPLMATMWSAIGQLRAHVESRSGGRTHYQDPSPSGSPGLVTLNGDFSELEPHELIALDGKRVLVAHPDPAVTWFCSELIRGYGAEVDTARDGANALRIARRRRPDAIVTGLLMPGMDGLTLAREIEQDPALFGVPLAFLPEHHEAFARMRELGESGGAELRRERSAAEIVRRVANLLRPRLRLEEELRDFKRSVGGRIESTGLLPLLHSVAEHRGSARVSLRDGESLFEIDIQEGDLVHITRTAMDGTFARGPRALTQMLGVGQGRFHVEPPASSVRPSVGSGRLHDTLRDPVDRLRSTIDAVKAGALSHAAEVEFDADALASIVRNAPPRVQSQIERLRAGEGPRAMLMSGTVEPHSLESLLVNLARRGVLIAVRDEHGSDRPAAQIEHDNTESPPGSARGDEASPAEVTRISDELWTDSDDAWVFDESSMDTVDTSREVSASESASGLSVSDKLQPHQPGTDERTASRNAAGVLESDPVNTPPSIPPNPSDPPGESGVMDEPQPAVDLEPGDQAPYSPDLETDTDQLRMRNVRRSPMQRILWAAGWLVLLAALATAGFVAMSMAREHGWLSPKSSRQESPGEGTSRPATATAAADPKKAMVVEEQAIANTATGKPTAETAIEFGETLNHIEDANVDVPAEHGLLIVNQAADGINARIRVNGSEVGVAPLQVALREGQHELAFVYGDQTVYRYVFIRTGQTRVVPQR